MSDRSHMYIVIIGKYIFLQTNIIKINSSLSNKNQNYDFSSYVDSIFLYSSCWVEGRK